MNETLMRIRSGLRSGNEENIKEAFRLCFLTFSTPMLRVARKALKSEAMAQDMVQEIFADLWQRPGNLANAENIAAYFIGATKYACLKMLTQKAKEKKMSKMYHKQHEDYSVPDVFRSISVIEEPDLIVTIINGLPELKRRMIAMKYFENKRYATIGRELGLSESAVAKQVDRIREELLEKIELILKNTA